MFPDRDGEDDEGVEDEGVDDEGVDVLESEAAPLLLSELASLLDVALATFI